MKKKKRVYSKIILLGSKGSIGKSLKNFFFLSNIDCISYDLPKYDITKKNLHLNKNIFSKKYEYTIINCIGLMGADYSKDNIEKFLHINGLAVLNIFKHFQDVNIRYFHIFPHEKSLFFQTFFDANILRLNCQLKSLFNQKHGNKKHEDLRMGLLIVESLSGLQ